MTDRRTPSSEELEDLRRRLDRAVTKACPHWMPNEREDLVQIGMMKVLRRIETGDLTNPLPNAYLEKVAYNAMIDEIRRRQRRREQSLEALEEGGRELSDRAPDPEEETAERELQWVIRRCLLELSRDRRHATTLWLMEHTNVEIAKLMAWDRKRAENLVTRGRADLRTCLKRKGYTL